MRKQAGIDEFNNFPYDKKNSNTTSTSVSNSNSSTSGNFSLTTSNSSDFSSTERSNSLESRPGGYISVCQNEDVEDYGDSIEMKPRAKRRRKGVFRFIRERIHKIISKREKQLT